MPDIKEIIAALDRIGAAGGNISVETQTLRHALRELGNEFEIAKMDLRAARHRVAELESRDADLKIKELSTRLADVTALKDSYSGTIEAAMTCVEAVLGAVCGTRKADIQGAGQAFFEDAAKYLPRKIEAHVRYVKTMADDSAALTAVKNEANQLRSERNVAVRKQLDLEQAVRTLREQVAKLTSADVVEDNNRLRQRLATAAAEESRLRKEIDDLQRACESNSNTAEALQSRVDVLEAEAQKFDEKSRFNHGEYLKKLDAKDRAIVELQQVVSGDVVAKSVYDTLKSNFDNLTAAFDALVEERNKLHAEWNSNGVGKTAFGGEDIPPIYNCNWVDLYTRLCKRACNLARMLNDARRFEKSNEELRKILGDIGSVFGWGPRWWELSASEAGPVGMVRRRVDAIKASAAEEVSKLTIEVDKLTNVVFEYSKKEENGNAPR